MTDADTTEARLDAALDWARQRWAGFLVTLLGVFMFWTRMRPYSDYNQGAQHYFIGTDAYYHARHVLFSVRNFPTTLGFDPWTQYPFGTDAAQFGTLFDQIAAGFAWIAGLLVDQGAPTQDTILDVLTWYPALLGALALIPIYLFVRDAYGTKEGLFVAIATALIPGAFLQRTIAGWPDHHSIEIVLSALTIWASYRALKAWEQADPHLADLVDAPRMILDEHRGPLGVSLLAAVAFLLYIGTWSPGILFVAIVGGWLGMQTLIEVAREEDPGPVVATGVTLFSAVAVLLAPLALGARRGGFSAVRFSWLQPLFPLLIAIGLIVLAVSAVWWRRERWPSRAYPAAAVGAGGLTVALLALAWPGLIDPIASGASWVLDSTLGWLPGIGVERTRLTIVEAQPASLQELPGQVGFLFYTAIAAFVVAAYDAVRKQDRADALLLVWGFVMISGALTQSRFLYYLSVVVLALNGKFAHLLYRGAAAMADEGDQGQAADRIDPQTGKIAVAVLLALVLLPVNVTGFSSDCQGDLNSWSLAGCFGPQGETRDWTRESQWLNANTPQGPVSLTTAYDPPPTNEPFPYEDGAYGILSWWDYGHIVEFHGERAPIANPFQQNAPLASEIFTARSETQALEILDEYLGEGNQARYLMIDDAMATRKFGAITVWAEEQDTLNQGGSDRFRIQSQGQSQTLTLPTIGPEIRSMFLIDTYYEDGSGSEHFRLVREHPQYAWMGNRGRLTDDGFNLQAYNTILGISGPDRMRASFNSLTYESGDRVLNLGNQRVAYDVHVESVLKTYERVPGATLTGTGDPGETVNVTLPLTVEPVNRDFTYTQTGTVDSDGRFEITVPYSTTDPVPVSQGGTNTTVTANGPYEVTIGNQTQTAQVPDRAVLEGGTVRLAAPS